jgi:hypothetical protein
MRLLNLDDWGRKFAEKKYSNVIIMSSACRSKVSSYIGYLDHFSAEEFALHGIPNLRVYFD